MYFSFLRKWLPLKKLCKDIENRKWLKAHFIVLENRPAIQISEVQAIPSIVIKDNRGKILREKSCKSQSTDISNSDPCWLAIPFGSENQLGVNLDPSNSFFYLPSFTYNNNIMKKQLNEFPLNDVIEWHTYTKSTYKKSKWNRQSANSGNIEWIKETKADINVPCKLSDMWVLLK